MRRISLHLLQHLHRLLGLLPELPEAAVHPLVRHDLRPRPGAQQGSKIRQGSGGRQLDLPLASIHPWNARLLRLLSPLLLLLLLILRKHHLPQSLLHPLLRSCLPLLPSGMLGSRVLQYRKTVMMTWVDTAR